MLYKRDNIHGGDIYTQPVKLDFSASINPFGTPPSVLSAMKDALSNSGVYPDPYCRKAVQSISEYESVSQEHILMGNGAAELIYTFCAALRPEKALITDPSFSEYETALRIYGCDVKHYMLREDNNFSVDEGLLSAIRKQTPNVLFICNPNNPTGKLVDPSLLDNICKLCEEQKTFLFIDECFLDFAVNGSSLKRKLAENSKLFILKAFTKSFALPGVRVGYCMCSDTELLAEMSKFTQPWNISVMAQAAAVAACSEIDYLNRTREYVASEREWLKEKLENFGFPVIPSEANFLLFHGPKQLDRLLLSEGIAIRNCSSFLGLKEGWFRISVRRHEENEMLIEAIHKLQKDRYD